jgi:hypothetical protein
MPPTNVSVNGVPQPDPIWCHYEGTEVLQAGYPMCFDHDHAAAADGSLAERSYVVEQPSLLNFGHFAGYVAEGQGTKQGPCWVSLIPPAGNIPYTNANVWTRQNVTAGDFLEPIPGSWYWGKQCIGDTPIFRATQTVDRSATAGVVMGEYGAIRASWGELASKVVLFRDHYVGMGAPNATADVGAYDVNAGNAGTVLFDDDATGGVLELTSGNSGFQCQIALNGEPFTMAAEKSVFFRARINVSKIDASCDAFVGLTITDSNYWSTKPTDYMGFEIVDGALTFVYVKDGTTGLVTSGTLATLVADTFVEVAFHYDGEGHITVWVNGVAQTITTTTTEVPDNENLTFQADIVSNAAAILRLDRLEIGNYFG